MSTAPRYQSQLTLLFPHKNNAVAAAKDDMECPDGKENPRGGSIKSCTAALSINGRSRPTIGLMATSPMRKAAATEQSKITPVRLHF